MPKNNTFNHDDFEVLSQDTVYEGMFRMLKYKLRHKLYNGGWTNEFHREVFSRNEASAVLPYDPNKDRVILIEQFRIGSIKDADSPWQIEIPAGVIEPGETPDNVAHRETFEEAGCMLQELTPIFKYFVSPGGCDEFLHLYCAKIDSDGVGGFHGLAHENEDIRVLNISTAEAIDMLNSGEIKNAPAIIALLWLQRNKYV